MRARVTIELDQDELGSFFADLLDIVREQEAAAAGEGASSDQQLEEDDFDGGQL